MESIWAAFYRDDMILSGLQRVDAEPFVAWMNVVLPWDGSKVAWDKLPGEHRHWSGIDEEQIDAVLRELTAGPGSDATVVHVGDSLSPYAVRFGVADVRRVVPSLLAIPEHHYFLAEDRSWLVAFTMEGDVDLQRFGGRF